MAGRALAATLWFTLSLSACAPEEGRGPGARIDAAIESVIASGEIAGAAVVVLHGSDILHARGYGFADREDREPAGPETLFNLGSVTKLFTGAALIALAESGALSLDDPLSRWVPEFPNPEQAAAITLRQLVDHTSGLSDYLAADLAGFETTGVTMTRGEVLEYLRGRPLDFAPGTHWAYTNTGFYLAGVVIERASGQPWAEYVAERIVAPLDIHDIHLCDDVREQVATGYVRGDTGLTRDPVYLVAGLRGDGGFCASALGLARFPGRLAAGSVLTPEGRASMIAATPLASGVTVDYGMGARRGRLQGHPLWGHTGGHAGTVAVVAHFPEDDLTIAVLMNTVHSRRDALVLFGEVAVPVLGLDTTPPAALSVPDDALQRYVGRYVGGREGGHYDVSADSGRVRIRWSGGDSDAAYLPVGEDRFVRDGGTYPLDRYVFQSANGRIIALSDYYNGFHQHFRQRIERVPNR